MKLTVTVKKPDKLGGGNAYSTLGASGSKVEAGPSVYDWRIQKRKISETNQPSVLPAADGEWLFLSSANLTQPSIHRELGMLVGSGPMPKQVEK